MMVEELRVFGVFLPAPLVWAILAMVITYLLRRWLYRLPLYALLWQPALLELAVFVVIWWCIAQVADVYLPIPGVS
jgi:protein AaeX